MLREHVSCNIIPWRWSEGIFFKKKSSLVFPFLTFPHFSTVLQTYDIMIRANVNNCIMRTMSLT